MERLNMWGLLLVLLGMLSLSSARPLANDSTKNIWAALHLQKLLTDVQDDAITLEPHSATNYNWQPSKAGFSTQRKRGFSVLARWQPFNSFGHQRTSISKMNRVLLPTNEVELVSTETRAFARPQGQPLRWG